jgi:peptidoglycan hydrolase-like protein with peptidoglycan-binding domain
LARLAGDPYIVERMGKSMSRVLQIGDSGADVALLQRDLNVWYGYWGAPARVMLDRDGDLGPSTELAFRRVRARLGLELVEKAGRVQITPRDRVLVRHLGRLLVAKRAGHTHEIPASIKRTPEEIARGKKARAYETRLRARFREMREHDKDLRPEITANSPNQSSRNGLKPRIIVLHTTEGHNRPGLSDLRGLVSFFNSASSQVSSHVANDGEGNDARIVPDDRKAFTQAAFNSIALSIEQIGFASQTEFPEAQLRNTARWIAHWSRRFGIPIQHSTIRGVCQHKDLGARGGGHHDCGPDYPLGRVLAMARSM